MQAETAWQRQKEAQQKHDQVELLYTQLQELTQQKHAEEARARRHAKDVQRAKLEFEEATRKLRAAESEVRQRQEEQRREEEAERLRREEEQARRIEEEVEKRIQDKVQAELHRRLAAEERRLREAEEMRRGIYESGPPQLKVRRIGAGRKPWRPRGSELSRRTFAERMPARLRRRGGKRRRASGKGRDFCDVFARRAEPLQVLRLRRCFTGLWGPRESGCSSRSEASKPAVDVDRLRRGSN
eukprot:s2088_g4.t1